MCLGWMDYCFRFFLICPLPPAPCHGSSGGPAYVMVARVSLQGGLWTGSWFYSSIFPSCCWSLAFLSFSFLFLSPLGKEVLISNRSFNPFDLSPAPGPAHHPPRSGEFQHSRGAVVLRLEQIGSPSYFIYSPVRPPLWRALCTHYNSFAFFIW